ncbi:MAG: hypothetical protein JXB05_37225 [Myxococcaceae bacterium]|nr:hypothetical protein [Myxococcaceae bacterium]
MSPRRALLSVALIALGLLSACALRLHYRDMVQPEGASAQAAEGHTLTMRIVDPSTGQPISGAKVFAGSGRARLAATSDAEGRLSVPVSQALIDENPLVEVVLPKGVKSYQFQVLRPEEPAAAEPPAAEAPPAQPAEAPEETNSTGSIAPSSPTAPETPPAPPPSSPEGQN